MNRSRLRWLPAVAVVVVLAAALVAPTRKVGAERWSSQVDYLYYPICTPLQGGNAGSPYHLTIGAGEGVLQPIGPVGNFSTCSLMVHASTYAAKRIDVVLWDPQALAPDPTTVKLRTISYSATYSPIDASRFDLFPPVVTRTVPGVAEAPRAETAVEYRVTSGNSELSPFSPDGPAAAPVGMRIVGNTRQSLAGNHPVFAHSICGGDEALQSLHVVQSVMTTNADTYPASVEYIQKFQVPVATSLRWIELAFQTYTGPSQLDLGHIMVVDAQGQDSPGYPLGPPLTEADFRVAPSGTNSWASHYDFPNFPVLEARHDYWLVVTTHRDYRLWARYLTGSESPYFTTTVGRLYHRSNYGDLASWIPGRVLSFRVIGLPIENIGVGAGAPAREPFLLAVVPNPARGAAVVTWSGARGDVRFEVIDARGRRVAGGSTPAAAGRWTFSARGADGRSLPAGIYFVRGRDAAGGVSSARVSLVR